MEYYESYYDIFDDWELIESSFLEQYGIRLRQTGADEISYQEFCSLLSGINQNTALGKIVSIRAETDSNIIKNYNAEQRRIRSEWILKRNERMKTDERLRQKNIEEMKAFQEYCKKAFSK